MLLRTPAPTAARGVPFRPVCIPVQRREDAWTLTRRNARRGEALEKVRVSERRAWMPDDLAPVSSVFRFRCGSLPTAPPGVRRVTPSILAAVGSRTLNAKLTARQGGRQPSVCVRPRILSSRLWGSWNVPELYIGSQATNSNAFGNRAEGCHCTVLAM